MRALRRMECGSLWLVSAFLLSAAALCVFGMDGLGADVRVWGLGKSLHGVHEWRGQLVLNDWETGAVFLLDVATGSVQQLPVLVHKYVCDIEIDGDVLSAIGEGDRYIEQHDLVTGFPLSLIPIPSESGLEAFDIQGFERVGSTIYLLGCSRTQKTCGSHLHRIVTMDAVSGELLGIADGYTCGELVGLQQRGAHLWTFEYGPGLLWEVQRGSDTFTLERSVGVLSQLPAGSLAEGGLVGFCLAEDFIVLTSIWANGPRQDSHVHILEYPAGFPL